MGTRAVGRPPPPGARAGRPAPSPAVCRPRGGGDSPAVQLSAVVARVGAASRVSRAPAPGAATVPGPLAELGKSSRSFCGEKWVEEWGCRRAKPASCE